MSYASDDAQTAYLFQCGTEELFAVSLDKAGARLPRSSWTQGWILREEFQLGVQHSVPAAIAPEPKHGKPEIFNTDQGSQFTGTAFTGVLIETPLPSAWTEKGPGGTTCSSSGYCAASNMRRCI